MKWSLGISIALLILPSIVSARTIAAEDFGANIHLMQRFPEGQWSDVLAAAQGIDVKTAREEFSWNSIEPSEGEFDWSTTDAMMHAYEEAHISVVGLLTYSSDWATTVSGNTHAMPDISAWEIYVSAVSARYAGRVAGWEIWNEPNHPSFFSGTALEYAEVLNAASTSIRASDSSARIVLGGLSGADTNFLHIVLPRLSPGAIDAVAIHPYRVIGDTFTYAPEYTEDGLNTLEVDMANVRAELEHDGFAKMPLWITEFGYPTHEAGLSEAEQAEYLGRAYTILLSQPRVQKIFWYNLVDTGTDVSEQEQHFGLFDTELQAKSAALMFSFLAEHLTQAVVKGLDHALTQELAPVSALSWSTEGAVCSSALVHRDSVVAVSYDFPDEANCYVPIETAYQLPQGTQTFVTQLVGAADDTVLRVRITDHAGETFQYSLAHIPHSETEFRVDLNQHAVHWGGNDDGVLDQPLTFTAFVLDNVEGHKQSGTLEIRSLRAGSTIGLYVYRFAAHGKRRVIYWTTEYPAIVSYRLKRKQRVRIERFNALDHLKQGKNIRFKANQTPKILSVE